MSIPLTTSSTTIGLFNRLGKLGLLLADINVYQGTTLPADVTAILDKFQGPAASIANPEPDIVASLPGTDQPNNQGSVGGITNALATEAQNTVIRMVFRDNPQPDLTLLSALKELIRQMKAAAATVKACTITGTVNAAPSITNVGNGVCIVSTKRGDGLVQENTFAETENIVCTSDAQTGGAQSGNETFTFKGGTQQTNQLINSSAPPGNWPAGSGAIATTQAVNAPQNNTQGNLLTNSDFENWTANVPNNWTLAAGVAGTDFAQGATAFRGTSAAKWIGGTGTNASITQTFNLAGQTLGALAPDTQYGLAFWIKSDVVPAAGVLTIDLVDGSNVVINDDQAVANSFTVTLSGTTTSYVSRTGVFRTPKTLPSTIKLRLRLTTGLSAGSNLFVDGLGFGLMTQLYSGGPSVNVFSGSVPFIATDAFQLVFTNDRGGATNNKTFQTLFDRFFSMKSLGLLLPSAGSPTILDSLIG